MLSVDDWCLALWEEAVDDRVLTELYPDLRSTHNVVILLAVKYRQLSKQGPRGCITDIKDIAGIKNSMETIYTRTTVGSFQIKSAAPRK